MNRGNLILNRLFFNSVHSIRRLVCNDSEAKAMYRFLQNDRVCEEDILKNMSLNSITCVGNRPVLCIQDTSYVNLYNHKNGKSKEVLQTAGEIIIIQDREGDIYERFAIVPNPKTHLLIRAKTNDDGIEAKIDLILKWFDLAGRHKGVCRRNVEPYKGFLSAAISIQTLSDNKLLKTRQATLLTI